MHRCKIQRVKNLLGFAAGPNVEAGLPIFDYLRIPATLPQNDLPFRQAFARYSTAPRSRFAATSYNSPKQHASLAFRGQKWTQPALFLLGGFLLGRWSQNQESPAAAAADLKSDWSQVSTLLLGLLTPLQAVAQASSSLLPEPSSPPLSAPSSIPLAGCLSPYFIADAAAKAAPAVVNILVQQDGALPVGSSGSGFVVSADGTVLTNAHVVADAISSTGPGGRHFPLGPGRGLRKPPISGVLPSNASSAAGTVNNNNGSASSNAGRSITVTLQDGRIFEAELVSYDTVSDLAVLKVKADSPLPVARLGSSAGLRVGEWVLALGSPLHLQNSVSAGIISCVDRKAVELGLAGARTEYIQTDASINRGSSGGPLVNLAGEVVGVSCMKAVGSDGVSFCIPIDTVREVVRQLEIYGRVIRPFIGVKLLQLNRHTVAQMRKKDLNFPNVAGGVLVPQVAPRSPAAQAGLRQGDIIVRYGGSSKDVTTSGLIKALEEHIGRPLEVEVVRPDGKGGSTNMKLSLVAEEAHEGGAGGVQSK